MFSKILEINIMLNRLCLCRHVIYKALMSPITRMDQEESTEGLVIYGRRFEPNLAEST